VTREIDGVLVTISLLFTKQVDRPAVLRWLQTQDRAVRADIQRARRGNGLPPTPDTPDVIRPAAKLGVTPLTEKRWMLIHFLNASLRDGATPPARPAPILALFAADGK
jgi:hypothetical protein